VLADVRDGKVSPEKAREAYGVVVADGRIDEAATAERRRELRTATAADGGTGPPADAGTQEGGDRQ
jgi:N-methylhydantoinase B